MRTARFAPVVVLALAFLQLALPRPALADPTPGTRTTVVLVPLGDFPPELLSAIGETLARELQVAVKPHPRIELPAQAYYPPRKRYRADQILTFLDGIASDQPAGTRVLALTTVDISTTKGKVKDWGIFGLGEIGRRNCVVSIFRLRRNARDPQHLAKRFASIVTHEVGHTLGLPHCPTPHCVMEDAEGSITNTDTGTGKLCGTCRATVDRLMPIH